MIPIGETELPTIQVRTSNGGPEKIGRRYSGQRTIFVPFPSYKAP